MLKTQRFLPKKQVEKRTRENNNLYLTNRNKKMPDAKKNKDVSYQKSTKLSQTSP